MNNNLNIKIFVVLLHFKITEEKNGCSHVKMYQYKNIIFFLRPIYLSKIVFQLSFSNSDLFGGLFLEIASTK